MMQRESPRRLALVAAAGVGIGIVIGFLLAHLVASTLATFRFGCHDRGASSPAPAPAPASVRRHRLHLIIAAPVSRT